MRQDEPVTDRRLMTLAVFSSVPAARIRELAALGFPGLTLKQVIEMAIHCVTSGYVREMRQAGHRDLSPERLVRMRVHGSGSRVARSRGP